MSELGSQIVFKELLARHQRIQVPMIQRDYAQGRESEKEVRDEFLDALHVALTLPEDDTSLPLNLDFIYGSVEGDGTTRFLPLDGQQRLTTLFFLHWYLAWRDGCSDEFKQMLCPEGPSRFAYSVRPSSTEFFNALVAYKPELTPDAVDSLSLMLADQSWYFRNWRLDPTIQSSLNMLDAIHRRFKDSSGLFARITNIKRPAITFQLLDLMNFGLSDDLYIKMNSRGKPLTPFETFKARFEQRLKDLFAGETLKLEGQDVSISEFFSRRMDTQWADFFWPHRNPEDNVFDAAIMNLFRTVILITRSPDSDSFVEDVTSLRNKAQKNTYSFFSQSDWLDRNFSKTLILLLETWSSSAGGIKTQLPDGKYFDEENIFEKAIFDPTGFGYEEVLQFAAYVQFLKENKESRGSLEFQEWMRIIFNLSSNTVYNRPLDLQRSIDGLVSLIPYPGDILKYFANTEKPVSGFNADQINEEILKSQLMSNRLDWRPLIFRAEEHGYFRGQIGFLLDFCGVTKAASSAGVASWNDETHAELQAKFNSILQKAEAMFSSKGLQDLPDFKWERALLCVGNYLLPNRMNFSFLVNSQTDHASWKRLLRDPGVKRNVLCDLWKRLNGIQNLSVQLDTIIAESTDLEPWREALVRTPAAINYCDKRLIRFENDEVYLLQTTQMNGTHAELFTYCLYANMLKNIKVNGCQVSYYSAVGTDTEPGIVLNYRYNNEWLPFYIDREGDQFVIYIFSDKITPYPLIQVTLLENLGFSQVVNTHRKTITIDLIESFILNLAEKLASTPIPEQNNA